MAEENLMLLGLQVQKLMAQTSDLFDILMYTLYNFVTEIRSRFPCHQRDSHAKQASRSPTIPLQGALDTLILTTEKWKCFFSVNFDRQEVEQL